MRLLHTFLVKWKEDCMVPTKQHIVMGARDVTGDERFFVISEGEEKKILGVFTTLSEARSRAEYCASGGVSILRQVGYGFRME